MTAVAIGLTGDNQETNKLGFTNLGKQDCMACSIKGDIMDRRAFLAASTAVVASAGLTGISLAQDRTAPTLPRRGAAGLRAVQGPYQLNIGRRASASIGRVRRASAATRRATASAALQDLPDTDAFIAQRMTASRNLMNDAWLRDAARMVFDNPSAQRAFTSWLPSLNDQVPSRALTTMLVDGGDDFSGPTLMAYAAVSAASGYGWEDIVDTLHAATSGQVALTKDDGLDLSGGLQVSITRGNGTVTAHLTQLGNSPRMRPRHKASTRSPLRKRGFFGGALKVLTGAAAGAALGTLATGGVPGPGTVVGGVAGGLIGLGAALEDEGGGDSNSSGGGGAAAGGGGTGFWDGGGECPPADQPYVLC
ncbi:hypothetical protein [Maricaulis sp.]|uniref:hypothetical protein n=1 Tax=Maricaulis sp. TaxID=1486257 RepID=UPI0025BCC23C|nr:hypothetical protein [Maricaulis sp.]